MDGEFEVDERGYFWWSDVDIPDGNFAPHGGAFGRLTISSLGEARLDLDTTLSTDGGKFAALGNSGLATSRLISGILKERTEHLLLGDVRANGPAKFASNGICYQGYSAGKCLIGQQPFGTCSKFPVFSKMRIPMSGYSEWLGLRGFKIQRQADGITLQHKVRAAKTYEHEDITISMVFDVNLGNGQTYTYNYNKPLILEEFAFSVFDYTELVPIEKFDATFRLFEELMLLLTDAERSLDYPSVEGEATGEYKYYFRRITKTSARVRAEECWLRYSEIEDSFGDIVRAYMKKRHAIGSGFYMYLGNRRGMDIYAEHRFISLVIGLEALHQTLSGKNTDAGQEASKAAHDQRVEGIVGQIEDDNDRKWVADCLNNTRGPTLKKRLTEILSGGPISLDGLKLKKFVARCSKLRHTVAHTGDVAGSGDYQQRIRNLYDVSDALSVLYHAVILQELSIPPKTIQEVFSTSRVSGRLQSVLETCGLLDCKPTKNDS